jgi:hypothetical protein
VSVHLSAFSLLISRSRSAAVSIVLVAVRRFRFALMAAMGDSGVPNIELEHELRNENLEA